MNIIIYPCGTIIIKKSVYVLKLNGKRPVKIYTDDIDISDDHFFRIRSSIDVYSINKKNSVEIIKV